MSHAVLVESCIKYDPHMLTMVWSSLIQKVQLVGHFGHYGQNIEAESLINLARCVLWCRINIVDCKDHVCGFFIWTALVKPYGGQTNMGWQGDIDHVSVIGHV